MPISSKRPRKDEQQDNSGEDEDAHPEEAEGDARGPQRGLVQDDGDAHQVEAGGDARIPQPGE